MARAKPGPRHWAGADRGHRAAPRRRARAALPSRRPGSSTPARPKGWPPPRGRHRPRPPRAGRRLDHRVLDGGRPARPRPPRRALGRVKVPARTPPRRGIGVMPRPWLLPPAEREESLEATRRQRPPLGRARRRRREAVRPRGSGHRRLRRGGHGGLGHHPCGRNHAQRYADGLVPPVVESPPSPSASRLRRIQSALACSAA